MYIARTTIHYFFIGFVAIKIA